jgi:hypothetical protein
MALHKQQQRHILPRTPLTDLAELMVRHPRVLNYGPPPPPWHARFRTEARELIDACGGVRRVATVLGFAALLFAASLGSGWCLMAQAVGTFLMHLSWRYDRPSIWW